MCWNLYFSNADTDTDTLLKQYSCYETDIDANADTIAGKISDRK